MNIVITLVLLVLLLVLLQYFNKSQETLVVKPMNIKGYEDLKNDESNFKYTSGGISKILIKTSFQARGDFPIQMTQSLETTKQLSPDYELYYFDDRECQQFMQEFSPDAYACYQKIKPNAFKSDLFRLCVLYKYGGCYSDIGHTMKVSLDTVCLDNTMVLVLDHMFRNKTDDYGYYGIHNAFMCTTRGHPFFKALIDKCIENIQKEFYGENCLDITGPYMVGKVFNCFFENVCDYKNKELIKVGTTFHGNTKLRVVKLGYYVIVDENNNEIINTKFDNYYYIMNYGRNELRYCYMWMLGQVYTNSKLLLYLLNTYLTPVLY